MAKKNRHEKQVLAVFLSGTLLVVTLVAANIKVTSESKAVATWGKRDVCHQCMPSGDLMNDPDYKCMDGQNLRCVPRYEFNPIANGSETIGRCVCPSGSTNKGCVALQNKPTPSPYLVGGYKNLPPMRDFESRYILPEENCWRMPTSVPKIKGW